MSSLFGNLSVALRALLAQQGDTEDADGNLTFLGGTGKPSGFPFFAAGSAGPGGPLALGAGISLEKVEAIRDRILELRIHQEMQKKGDLDAFVDAIRRVEAVLGKGEGKDLGDMVDGLFENIGQLATNPSSLPLRQGVLNAASDLAGGFRRRAESLVSLQRDLDSEAAQTVADINRLTGEVADLNRRASELEAAGQDPQGVEHSRTKLIRELSKVVDIAVIDAGGGFLTITTSNGTALVVGGTNIELRTQESPTTGFQNILAQGTDITTTVNSGRLGGLLEVREQTIPSIAAELDSLATDLAKAMNTVHRAGFSLSGAAGGDLFVPPPETGIGAAASSSVAITDPAQVAASSDGRPGDKANLLDLMALRDQGIVGGQRAADFYASLLARVANDIANSSADQEAQGLVLQQLETQRSVVSGTSLDEEAVNLLRFQRALEAAARVVSMVDELTQSSAYTRRS